MKVGVAYVTARGQWWLECEVESGCTVRQAIEQSGILRYAPEVDLQAQRVGVFGKLVKLDAPLQANDRVEIYRPLIRCVDEDDEED